MFGGKPVALMGASVGGFGSVLGQNAWLPVLRILGTKPWFGPRLTVAKAGSVFDASGAITDQAIKDQLTKFMESFVAFVRASAKG